MEEAGIVLENKIKSMKYDRLFLGGKTKKVICFEKRNLKELFTLVMSRALLYIAL